MKKLYTEQKYIEHTRKKQKKDLARSQRAKTIGGGGSGTVLYPELLRSRGPEVHRRTDVIKAPDNFSFINNTVEMVMFFDAVHDITKTGRNVIIDLSKISALTIDALIVLLSKASDAKFSMGMQIWSNDPVDPILKDIFVHSGIQQYVDENTYRIRQAKGDADNGFVHKKKSYEVESKMVKDLITFATVKLYGTRSRRKGITRTLVECMNNTINHAAVRDASEEGWWATVHCDPEKMKAYFMFIDNGVGIFESLKIRSYKKQIAVLLGLRNNADLMKEILHGEIGSRTGLPYRGNGLPRIYEVAKRGQLGNLIIISNNVYANASTDVYTTLPFPFQGTFFHWEMTDA